MIPSPAPIRVAAVAFLRGGTLLVVRRRGTERFMLPGGKFEPHETAVEAACRELREELGLELAPERLRLVGTFIAPAANEPDHDVVATVFASALGSAAEPVPAAEIAELRLEPLGSDAEDLAPLLRQHVLPALRHLSAEAGV